MDVGRLDDISKNMGVQVKHGHPQNPVQQNMDVHGLNTCKTWASKNAILFICIDLSFHFLTKQSSTFFTTGVHDLNTCKTWASKNMKIWTPMLFETKVWTIERHVDRSNVWTIDSLFNQIYFCPTWIECCLSLSHQPLQTRLYIRRSSLNFHQNGFAGLWFWWFTMVTSDITVATK